MPAKFRVSITRAAESDIEQAWSFIAQDSPETADKFISRLMLIRLFQQDTTYSVRAWRGLRFPVVCENSSGSSPAKRPVSSIWPPVVGLMDLSVRAVGTSMRMS